MHQVKNQFLDARHLVAEPSVPGDFLFGDDPAELVCHFIVGIVYGAALLEEERFHVLDEIIVCGDLLSLSSVSNSSVRLRHSSCPAREMMKSQKA